MIKCLIKWDVGYGEDYEVVEVDNLEDAEKMAYDAWREAVEQQANHGAEELTEELIKEYGLDEEL